MAKLTQTKGFGLVYFLQNEPISIPMRRITLVAVFLFSFSCLAASYQAMYCSTNFFSNKSYHKALQHTVIEADIKATDYLPTTYKADLKSTNLKKDDPFYKQLYH